MTGPMQPPPNQPPPGGYPPQQPGYPQQPAYPTQVGGFPPQGPPPQQPGYGGGYPPQQPPPKKRSALVWVLPLLLVLGGGGAAAYFLTQGDDNSSDTAEQVPSDGGGEVFGEAPNEILLEPANEVGPIPFSTTPFAPASPDNLTVQPVSNTDPTGPTRTSNGRAPGLYGGTNDNSLCDAEQMATFLAGDQAKAQAWVTALNRDPNVIASWGQALTPADIGAYIRGLTPVVLTSDTRVTNNGFRNGQPSPRQAVLQKGSAVLVDKNGVPRARCYCGNPLTAPQATTGTPKYMGGTTTWVIPVRPVVIGPPQPIIGPSVTPTPFATVPPGRGPCDGINDFDDYIRCLNNPGPAPTPDSANATNPTPTPDTSSGTSPTPTPDTSSGTSPTPTPVPAPTATPDSSNSGGNSPPVIDAVVEPDPSNTAGCSGNDTAYLVRISFSDADGDALLQPWIFTSDWNQISTFDATGDSSAGTIRGFFCGTPGGQVEFGIDDSAGNVSNDVAVTLPPDSSSPPPATATAVPATPTPAPSLGSAPVINLTSQPRAGTDCVATARPFTFALTVTDADGDLANVTTFSTVDGATDITSQFPPAGTTLTFDGCLTSGEFVEITATDAQGNLTTLDFTAP
ncbi:MAG: DUF6777 domain-containing protein [Actinomycetota bacterium]